VRRSSRQAKHRYGLTWRPILGERFREFQGFEKQLKADAVEVRDVSDRAKAALGKIASAKDDRDRAEASKAMSCD